MNERTALVTIDERGALLGAAVSVAMTMPATALTPFRGSVIAIARAGGGAGADTLASLLGYIAQQAGNRVTLVDFSQEGEEGPAWDRNGVAYTCLRAVSSAQLGAEIGEAIWENREGVVIINLPPNALIDLLDVEKEFVPLIEVIKRPYKLIWIDRPRDEKIDRIGGYHSAHGRAHGVVAVVQSESGQGERLNVTLPPGVAAPVMIPRLPSRVADLYYEDRMVLRDAIDRASVAGRASFFAKLKTFVAELSAVW